MARSFLRAWEMRQTWPEIPCLILTSEIKERTQGPNAPTEFRLALTYAYEWNGIPHIGENITLRENPWSSHRPKIEQQQNTYSHATRRTCRVNPAAPQTAVLKPDSLAPGYSIWFPALFVIGGIGMICSSLKKSPPARGTSH